MTCRATSLRIASAVAVVGSTLATFPQAILPTPISASKFHVTGVVLRDETNVPVSRCHLSIRLEGQRGERRRSAQTADALTAETDAQGRFSFDLPAEGKWQLSASANGYRTQFYNEHEGFSSAVVVHANRPLPALVFHLEADSIISGFVHDEAAEPVRNAMVSVQIAEKVSVFDGRRQRAVTDDRGHYEIAGLAPGVYKASVQGTPWYASGSTGRVADNRSGSSDPILDVVYPLTWYPGVLDVDSAGEVNLRGGEAKQLDFTLVPLAAAHLRVPRVTAAGGFPNAMPMVQRVENGQATGPTTPAMNNGSQLEFGNLAPGLYRVITSQADGHSATTFVRVSAGATVSLAGVDTAGTADVSFEIAGDENVSRVQVTLTDVVNGMIFTTSPGGEFGLRRRFVRGSSDEPDTNPGRRTLAVPPGRYQLTLSGDPDLYLRTIALRGRIAPGRILTVGGGSTSFTLDVARGRASVAGRAISAGRPLAGAMVMLVPTTFGQAGAIDLLRRDQSNTDGSFELEEVIPGDYILLAIDRGWEVNWHDAATLDRYLLQGIPLTLMPRARSEQEVQALEP